MDALIPLRETPVQTLIERARRTGERSAIRYKRRGVWHDVTWAEHVNRVRNVGYGLKALGCARGDVVAMLSENRPEWLWVDLGAQAFGMVGNGVYPTAAPDQLAYVLNDSGTRVLVVENEEQLDKALSVRARAPGLAWIVVVDPKGLSGFNDPGVLFFDRLVADGAAHARAHPGLFEEEVARGRREDLAFLVYTSGSTGAPKGAMVSNANVMFQLDLAPRVMTPGLGLKTLSFLPLNHIAERMGTVFNPVALGSITHFAETSGTVFVDMRQVQPHRVFGPPRFWEKLTAQMRLFMEDAHPLARTAYERAFALGRAHAERRLAGRAESAGLGLKLADALVFSNVRAFLGLSNVTDAVVGAAPVSPDLVSWYMALGIELLEAYGMTETTGFATATPRGRVRIGAAGRAVPGTEVRLGPEDEIEVRGPNVFAGYWKRPDMTAESFTPDGFLRTGDCGALDADGYLSIRDRIKDIMITSGGKNISPSGIETAIKFSPYVSDAIVIGEGRNYLTALVMIDLEAVSKFAADRNVPFTDFASLARAEEVRALVRAEIEAVNATLARVEQIKDFRIIDQLLTAEDEELTPTMKLKRRVVGNKYSALIQDMYSGAK